MLWWLRLGARVKFRAVGLGIGLEPGTGPGAYRIRVKVIPRHPNRCLEECKVQGGLG